MKRDRMVQVAIVALSMATYNASAQDVDPASDPNVQPGSPTTVSGYRLTWSDEFNGTALDESKWIYREGDDSRTFVKSFQTAANNSVSGGVYRCHLKKETMGTKEFTAGGIISSKRMRYGYYESRLRCPPTGGWHTSFWMMPYGLKGSPAIELDVIENDSINLYSYLTGAHRHRPTPFHTFLKGVTSTPNLHTSFHVFGCEFTTNLVRYFYNGEPVHEMDATQFAHSDLNVWLTSLALVYDGQAPVDESQLPVEAQYDYVRFFELGPYATAEITTPSSEGATLTDMNTAVELSATVNTFNTNATPEVLWSKLSGSGSVIFDNASSTNTGARFSVDGTYEIACSAIIDGVTNSDTVVISVNVPQTITVQHGINGYNNPCTFIRQDAPDRNSGADDEIIIGNWGGGLRGLLSFDLSDLESDALIQDVQLDLYNAYGSGTVGAMELRELTVPFVEGTGNGSSDTSGAGSGATWNDHTGANSYVVITTAAGTIGEVMPVSSAAGSFGTDYVYLETETDPGSSAFVLTDNRVDTGLLNVPDNAEYYLAETLTDLHVLTVVYDGSGGAYYDQPETITAYNNSDVQIGTPVAIPDLEASSFTTMNLARSSGSTLTGRGMFGFVVPAADFGGNASEITYVKITSTPDANQCDMHYVGSALADGTITSSGVQAITSVGTGGGDGSGNWAVAGGDFSSTVLSTVSGYNATVAGYKTFLSSPDFAIAAQGALDAGDPLDLIIYSPETESSYPSSITRFRSDDAAPANERPSLTVSYYGNYLPEIYAGLNLAGMTNNPVSLAGMVAHADIVEWGAISGPGSVLFSDATALTNSATFSVPGRYWIRLSGSNSLGTGFQDISVSIVDDRPFFSDTVFADDIFVFEVSSVTGLTYTLQSKTNLTNDWVNLYTTNATSNPMYLEGPISTNSSGFYRLILKP